MKSFVIDTSALVRLYVPDGPLPPGLEEALAAAWQGDAVLFTPALALAEFGQVLRKKEQRGFLQPEDTDDMIDTMLRLPLRSVEHADLLRPAVQLARLHSLTVYDALFLALAIKQSSTLFTADKKLQQVAQALGCG